MSKILELSADNEEMLTEVGKALSSETRIQILKLLYYNSYNIAEISEKLDIPASSTGLHIRILENAGLINTKIQPGNRGSMKLCSRRNDYINIRLAGLHQDIDQVKSISMPIGAYTDCQVYPTCGLVSETEPIAADDRPSDFFLPRRTEGQLLWTSSGYVEYKFPYPLKGEEVPKRLMLSFEACSEAPNFQEDWKSDITIWINKHECGTWTSPGDLGARRGRLNPSWWENGATQHGLLTTLEVTEGYSCINQQQTSNVKIQDLSLLNDPYITIRIGNKEDAPNKRGFNLFGEKFGDYEQDIILSLVY